MLECSVARHSGKQMLARGLELIAIEAQVDEKDPQIVFRRCRIECALAAGRAPAIEGLGADSQDELDCSFDLASVQRRLEKPELDSPSEEHAVEIECLVSRLAIACGAIVEVAIPGSVDLVTRSCPELAKPGDELVAERLGILPHPLFTYTQRRDNEWLILVECLGKVHQRFAIKLLGANMNVAVMQSCT